MDSRPYLVTSCTLSSIDGKDLGGPGVERIDGVFKVFHTLCHRRPVPVYDQGYLVAYNEDGAVYLHIGIDFLQSIISAW